MHFEKRFRIPFALASLILSSALTTVALPQNNPGSASTTSNNSTALDPGVRAGSVNAGQPLSTLSPSQLQFFQDGLARFTQIDSVSGAAPGEPGSGLGPGYNSTSCASCHAQPTVGGTSPSATAYPFIGQNPQTTVGYDYGAANQVPYFITADGPVREARFPYAVNSNGSVNTQVADGGVHDVFSIAGRGDAVGCVMSQPNFAQAQRENNLIFRIPTPTFGGGLIENIADATILANMAANAQAKSALGISGHPNYSGNDGSITRFGWKAQNKSLEIFAGEAYNVEMGVTNEIFQNERSSPDESLAGGLPKNCRLNPTPEDRSNLTASPDNAVPSDTVQFAMFMRMLAPPTPSTTNPGGAHSISNGSQTFSGIGCALCHTTALPVAPSGFTPGLGPGTANLFSDLLVHHMGSNLADGVSQGNAGTDEFRSAPLWGLGQRVFFLHDGRTTDLLDAIEEHASQGSEANGVIHNFQHLNPQQQQDLLNFLRSL